MKTEWDYTELVNAYLKRPGYAQKAIDKMFSVAEVQEGDKVCDVGAGTGNLTRMLAAGGLRVTAIEPNDAMRAEGIRQTAGETDVQWYEGTGECTGQPDNTFSLVSFGSSFNVTDRPLALKESHRILIRNGWFACMWNHRDLEDPVQKEIESIIRMHLPSYSYGTRREDQTEIIKRSGLFTEIQAFSANVTHTLLIDDVVEAWQSHATLKRQAGEKFPQIIGDIEAHLRRISADKTDKIEIPYITRVWMAKAVK